MANFHYNRLISIIFRQKNKIYSFYLLKTEKIKVTYFGQFKLVHLDIPAIYPLSL